MHSLIHPRVAWSAFLMGGSVLLQPSLAVVPDFLYQLFGGKRCTTTSSWWKPTPSSGLTWQWQLQGTIDTSYNVNMYDIDLFDTPGSTIQLLQNDGRVVICYFSAGTYEDWRPDASDFEDELLGNPLDAFPDERWLDIRNPDVRPIMEARLDLAVSKGCDGVEPDNVDAWQNDSGFTLTSDDQLVYNRWLATEAHERSLSVGLKNDVEQVKELVDVFDWALNESCVLYDECEKLLPFVNANKAVFGVEYEGDPADFCPDLNAMGYSWLKKDYDLFAEPRIDCFDY